MGSWIWENGDMADVCAAARLGGYIQALAVAAQRFKVWEVVPDRGWLILSRDELRSWALAINPRKGAGAEEAVCGVTRRSG